MKQIPIRYSIRSLLLVLLVTAIAVSSWNHYRLESLRRFTRWQAGVYPYIALGGVPIRDQHKLEKLDHVHYRLECAMRQLFERCDDSHLGPGVSSPHNNIVDFRLPMEDALRLAPSDAEALFRRECFHQLTKNLTNDEKQETIEIIGAKMWGFTDGQKGFATSGRH